MYMTIFQWLPYGGKKYNVITISGKRCIKNGPYSVRIDNLFSESFLAIWKYIDKNLILMLVDNTTLILS